MKEESGMNMTKTFDHIDQSRRGFIGNAAGALVAAGAFGLFPGQSSALTESNAVRPFRVKFPDAALVDLRRRIGATNWPKREIVTDASQGVQLATMKKLARYWETEHDWRKVEARLNGF